MDSGTASHNPSHKVSTSADAPEETQLVPTLTLNDGNVIPMLGYGTGTARARMGNTDASSIDPALVSTILTAIRAGYRHLDGAQIYGNESELGLALKQSGLPRSDFYITTKIKGIAPCDTEAAFATSLAKLGVDYVDLYLIHAPYFGAPGPETPASDEEIQAKWAEMEAIQASGRARSIGVSNFLQPHLEALLKTARVVPAINQIEYHPYLQHKGLIEFHQAHGIATEAYGPLSAVLFARPGPLDQYYANLANKYGVSEADVALRWVVDQGIVALTTSSNEERLKGYLANIDKWELREREVENIKEMGAEKHYRRFWNHLFAEDDRS